MPSTRLATAVLLVGALAGSPALAQDSLDGEPVARLALELQLASDRGQSPALNLLLGSKDQAVAMPLTGPMAGPAVHQLEGPDGFLSSNLSKWVWWGVSGVAVVAVVASQTGSDDDPAPSGSGAGP